MKTAVEKAEELVDKFRMNVLDYEGSGLNTFKAKQCALIAVDEILYNDGFTKFDQYLTEYWQEVKHELNKS
jgi:hypothetical protein